MRKFTLVTLSALIVVSLLSLAQVRGPVSAAQATGTGLREICRRLGVSINTVRKVRSALDPTHQYNGNGGHDEQ